MAENTFHLVIASVGETLFDSRAQSVTVPGASGEMQVLAHHEAIVTTLKPGTITVKHQSGTASTFNVDGGVLECANNKVVVLL